MKIVAGPRPPTGDTWGGPKTLPTTFPEILEALRNAGATEEVIAGAIVAGGEAHAPHRAKATAFAAPQESGFDVVDGCAGRPAKGRRWKSVTVKE